MVQYHIKEFCQMLYSEFDTISNRVMFYALQGVEYNIRWKSFVLCFTVSMVQYQIEGYCHMFTMSMVQYQIGEYCSMSIFQKEVDPGILDPRKHLGCKKFFRQNPLF